MQTEREISFGFLILKRWDEVETVSVVGVFMDETEARGEVFRQERAGQDTYDDLAWFEIKQVPIMGPVVFTPVKARNGS